MKFSNEKSLPIYRFAYYLLAGALIAFLCYNNIIAYEAIFSMKEVLIVFLVIITIMYFWYKKAKYFEYDSNGLALVFISKGILVSDFNNYREQRVEIPKSKLQNFKIVNWFFVKKIHLYIKGQSTTTKKVSIDISLLGNKKTRAIKESLNKVVRENSSN